MGLYYTLTFPLQLPAMSGVSGSSTVSTNGMTEDCCKESSESPAEAAASSPMAESSRASAAVGANSSPVSEGYSNMFNYIFIFTITGYS